MKRILLVLLACLALGACLLVLTEYPLNIDFLRGTLETELGSKLGCRVAIDGPIRVAVGFKPTFWLKNMSLARLTSSGDNPLLARMGMVKGKVDLFSLLKGEVRLGLLEMREVEGYLQASHDQLLALHQSLFFPQSANQPSTLFEIRRFSLEKLRILRPTPTGDEAQVWLALDKVTGTIFLDAHLKLKAEGRYQDAPFSFEVSGKSLQAWREGTQPWPLEISFHAGEGYARFETAITPPTHGADLTGRFTLTCSNLESLGLFFGANLPEFGSFDLKGRYESINDGVTLADLTGQVAALGESVFSGELRIQPHPAGLKVEGRLESNKFHIEKLAHLFVKADSWQGIIDSVAFTGASQGASPKDFLANLTGEVRLGNAILFFGDERSSPQMFVDSLIANLSTGQHLSCSVSGRWREEPFAVEFTSGPLAAYVQGENVAISLTGQIFEARIEGSGSIGRLTDKAGLDLKFKATGQALKSLRPWLNVTPKADLPYHLDGRLIATLQSLSLTQLAGKIGQSHFAGELVWRGYKAAPRLFVKIYSQTLQLAEFLSLANSPKTIPGRRNGQSSMARSLLSSLPSTDFELEIDRLLGTEQHLSNLAAYGHLGAGEFEASVSGDLWGTEFAGDLEAELNEGAILANLHLASHEVNISELLRRAGVNHDLDLSARLLELKVITQGGTLEALADRLSTTIRLKDGVIRGRDPGTRDALSLILSQAQIKVPPDSPVTAIADVLIHQKPAKLQLQCDLGFEDRVPFSVETRMAGAKQSFKGAVIRPLSKPQAEFSFRLTGQNLNSLSFENGSEMPVLGPYVLAGDFSMTPNRYVLNGIDLRLGTSHVTGNMDFITKTKRPQLTAQLAAKTLQLADFAPLRKNSDNPAGMTPSGRREARSDQATRTLQTLENWLRRLMRSLNVDLMMKADEVLSGTNRLGKGKVALTVKNGRLSLKELTGGMSAGEINLGLVLEEVGRDLKMETWGKVRHLDYGVLAQLLKLQGVKGGTLALDFRFKGVTPSLSDFLAYADGHFHSVTRPHQLETSDSGFWFIDFVIDIIPLLDFGPASQVNCIVGNFNLKDGLTSEANLLIDLTDEQIRGEGTINFKTETLNMVFHPEPKELVFKLPLPVRVAGSFGEYNFYPTPRKFLTTLWHSITVPVKRLISLLFPSTKIDVCSQEVK